MITQLPDDLEVARQLADIRVAVMEATQHVRSPRRSTRYRTTRNVIIAGAAVAILTAGTIVAVQASQSYIDHSVECYEHPDLGSVMVGVQGTSDPLADVLDPIEACSTIWRNDLFDESNNNDPDPNDGTSPVPDLVVCTLSSGAAAVFPREDGPSDDTDFCAALGLAVWDSD